ncbi:MAG TPA: fused MFS/spermidine synthase [Allosphingosinicella sp.]|nr:fused MFS/spermidine synthase [Allosphingosinicella sp.]
MAETTAASARERFARPLFLVTVVVGSFLLFVTQPMIARMALPRVGGAPAVWNSAMLVYQALLLGGYAYAHWLGRRRPRHQAGLHLLLFALAALWLPIGLRPDPLPPDADAFLWVPWLLVTSMGPLFFIISAQAPLMQRWYALESARGEPYALYAASNLGSFAGLLSYPLLVEPLLPLDQQSRLWTAGYGLLVLLVATCALTIPSHAGARPQQEDAERPGRGRVLRWILLAAVPSGLMLSTTTHLTTDIVAMPLLWVLPLGLYLLSFVAAFAARRGPTLFLTRLAPLVLLIGGGLAIVGGTQNPFLSAAVELTLLFVTAVTLHGEMYRLRPPPSQSTYFYLAMSVGGMLGGIFCAIVAPVIFDWTYEHPILILAAACLIPQTALFGFQEKLLASPRARRLSFVIPAGALLLSVLTNGPLALLSGSGAAIARIATSLLAVLTIGRRSLFTLSLAALMLAFGGWHTLAVSIDGDSRTRSYFGIYTVTTSATEDARVLTHGTTMHGLQIMTPGLRLEPTTYYAPRSGAGLAMRAVETLYGPHARIGVVGLGTGTLSCYAVPGQDWRFFEIDPAIVDIATRGDAFTFVRSCAPSARMLVGDARLRLADQPPASLDLLALDAFSSDAVPMHLLTHEAFEVYARALQPQGILLVHVSNRYIDLMPVIAADAAAGGWKAAARRYYPTREEAGRFASISFWVALSRDQRKLDDLLRASKGQGDWQALEARPGFAGWSDDYASILPLLKPMAQFLPFRRADPE